MGPGALLALIGPLALRVLTTLGIGLVTYTGVDTALSGLITQAQTNWAAVPAAVLQLGTLAGVPQGLSLVAGALTARVTAWVAVSATRWITKA